MNQVKINVSGGPVSLVVKSGPPCLGSFSIFYYDSKTGDVNQLFKGAPCSIADDIADSYPLPFGAADLLTVTLTINGKYGPLPNHSQVAVRYSFVQDGAELPLLPAKGGTIADNVTSATYKVYNHDFTFIQ